MKYVLGIDFGGGASKATLLCENGDIASSSTVEYPTCYPENGYVEQNPEDWFYATQKNIKNVLQESKINPEDICCVSLDAATHTAVLADDDFNVLMPSVYWTDIRSIKEVEYLKENFGELIFKQVLHNPDTIWTLSQLMWIKSNKPEIWSKTKKIMFAKDYVRHILTGDYVTDCIEAQGSMLYDSTKECWSEELCGILGLDTRLLPEIKKPSDIAGYVTKEAAEKTGLFEGTPVLCGTTDTCMEVFAAGATEIGQMTIKLATAGRICVVTDKAYPHQNLINYSYVLDNLWYPGTATKSCAASYRWYRDTFSGDYAELDGGAEKIPCGADGLIFNPYLNGELTPYADPFLCASFIGIRAGHTKAHFTRAVLEGVAMSLKDCMNAIEEIGISHVSEAIIIGGGSKSKLWRQIVSDVLGITLIEKKSADSSLGSAMLAGISAGIWKNPKEALEACNEVKSITEPIASNNQVYTKLFEKYKKVHHALAEIYHED